MVGKADQTITGECLTGREAVNLLASIRNENRGMRRRGDLLANRARLGSLLNFAPNRRAVPRKQFRVFIKEWRERRRLLKYAAKTSEQDSFNQVCHFLERSFALMAILRWCRMV